MRPLEAAEQNIPILLLLVVVVTAVAFLPAFMTAEWNGQCISPASDVGQSTTSRWAGRFILASIGQAILAVGLTGYLLYRGVFGRPEASRIIAAGGAGNWFVVGYFGFLTLGLLGTAAMGLFYWHIETQLERPYWGWTNLLAWGNLVLLNVGTIGSTFLMMHAGYKGGAAVLPPQFGGKGLHNAEIHTMLKGYPPYIAAFMALGILGVLLGCLGYLIALAQPALGGCV